MSERRNPDLSFIFFSRNIDKLHKLQAPHYDVPQRDHHFAGLSSHCICFFTSFCHSSIYEFPSQTEIWKHVSDLKQMVGPVYEAETKHNYQGPEPHQEDLSSEVGPVYRVERRHSFQKGFSCEIDKKTVKVGNLNLNSNHQQICRAPFMRWSTATSTSRASRAKSDRLLRLPVPFEVVTARDDTTTSTQSLSRGETGLMLNGLDQFIIFNIQRSKSVGFEVNTSDDFKEKETRSDDRSVSSELFSNIELFRTGRSWSARSTPQER